MAKSIYCIKDTKGGFISPICYPNDEIAKRALVTVYANKTDEIMLCFPADYELWKIGELNDRTGEIKPELQLIMTGIEAMNMSEAINKKKGE